MSNPLFVDTSIGWINLARVTRIRRSADRMLFIFTHLINNVTEEESVQMDWEAVPLKEGERIMQRLIGSEFLLLEP